MHYNFFLRLTSFFFFHSETRSRQKPPPAFQPWSPLSHQETKQTGNGLKEHRLLCVTTFLCPAAAFDTGKGCVENEQSAYQLCPRGARDCSRRGSSSPLATARGVNVTRPRLLRLFFFLFLLRFVCRWGNRSGWICAFMESRLSHGCVRVRVTNDKKTLEALCMFYVSEQTGTVYCPVLTSSIQEKPGRVLVKALSGSHDSRSAPGPGCLSALTHLISAPQTKRVTDILNYTAQTRQQRNTKYT